MKWWLAIISSLLLSTVSTSNSEFLSTFFGNARLPPGLTVQQSGSGSASSQDSSVIGDVPFVLTGLKRKTGQANLSNDLDRLGLHKNVTYAFTMRKGVASSVSDSGCLLPPPPLQDASSTPVPVPTVLLEPSSNESYTSNDSRTTINPVNLSHSYSSTAMYESGSEAPGSLFPHINIDRGYPVLTAPLAVGAEDGISFADGDFDNISLENANLCNDLLRNPHGDFDSSFSKAGAAAGDVEAGGIVQCELDENDRDIKLLLKMCGAESFDMDELTFPVEATAAADSLKLSSFQDDQDQFSSRAKAYSLSDKVLLPGDMREILPPIARARHTSGSPLFGKSAVKLEGPGDEPAPTASSIQPTISETDLEFAPWMPDSTTEIYAPIDDEVFKNTFDLSPFSTKVESVEVPDTEQNIAFFPDKFKPFRYYGEFPADAEKMAKCVADSGPLSLQVSAAVSKIRAKNLKAHYSEGCKSRHSVALEFAKKASEAGLMEGQWIHHILAGGIVDFFAVPFDFISPTEPWTVARGRRFIIALIPSLFHSPHVEENFSDFLNDFFLTKIVKKATTNQIVSESDRIFQSSELTKIAREMIKQLIPSPIFEKFISFVQPNLTPNDTESLYETLVETMINFKLAQPFRAPLNVLPTPPSRTDPRYDRYRRKSSREIAYAEDEKMYAQAMVGYKKMAAHIRAQERFHSEYSRNKRNQKNRSFEYLKILVNYLADPIMRPNSRWTNVSLLKVPNADASEMGSSAKVDQSAEKSTAPSSPQTRSKKRPAAKAEATAKAQEPTMDQLLFGINAHENQDFFDALFFSRILRACLILDRTVSFVQEYLDPFLMEITARVTNTPVGLRYLKAIDKFILLTRFNVVANVHPQIISYRRFLAAYLCRSGAKIMAVEPKKVHSRAVSMELFSLFESIHLFQVFGVGTEEENMKLLGAILAVRELSFQIPIIFLTYNVLNYIKIAEVIEKTFRENRWLSFSKSNAYYEIFAMSKNVDLLPIHDRKVLKFMGPPEIPKGPQDLVYKLENINQPMCLRLKLPENYEALYDWRMSRRLKNLSAVENHLKFPYGIYAVRMLLARRFGIPFDASRFSAQLQENFTWLEGIGFANFFLEREAQFLIDKAYSKVLDADHYQVYRVTDQQEFIHRSLNLPADEPIHYVNVLIDAGLSAMSESELAALPPIDQKFRGELFARYLKGMEMVKRLNWINFPKEGALDVLRFFLNESNSPEDFDPSDYPGLSV